MNQLQLPVQQNFGICLTSCQPKDLQIRNAAHVCVRDAENFPQAPSLKAIQFFEVPLCSTKLYADNTGVGNQCKLRKCEPCVVAKCKRASIPG